MSINQEQETPGNPDDDKAPISALQRSGVYGETTALLSYANTANDEIPAPSDLERQLSGRNYNTLSNSKYAPLGSGRYASNKGLFSEPLPGFYAVIITVVLQSVGFTLVIPSMYLYLKNLGGATAFYGWIVAIYSVGAFLGAIVFGWWSDHRTSKEGILVGSLISVGGNALYCAIPFFREQDGHWFMLFARFLVGFGSGIVAVCRAYLAENTDIKNKVKMMAAVSGAQGIGFVIGPALGSVLALCHFYIGPLLINQFTSPGYLSAIFCMACFVVVAAYLPAISAQKKEAKKKVYDTGEKKLPIYITLFLFFSGVSVFAIFETDFTILSKRDFDWGSMSNSIYFLICAIISTIMYAIIGYLPKLLGRPMDDRKMAALGLILNIIGMMCFVVYDRPWRLESKLSLLQLALGGAFFSVGYPLAQTHIFTMYSKILNPNVQGRKMGWITAIGSLARMLGPIYGDNALVLWGDAAAFGGTAAVLLLGVIALAVFYRHLIPHRDYGKEVVASNA